MGQLLNVQVEIQGSLALFDRIFEYLDLDPEITDAPDAVALEPDDVRGAVAFEQVAFHYPPSRRAARGRRRRGRADRRRVRADSRPRRSRPTWSDRIGGSAPVPAPEPEPTYRRAVRARGRVVRGAARASSWRWSARRAPARPRRRT